MWNGTDWVKVGGNNLVLFFTSGTNAPWKTPFTGVYKCTVVGGGGGGGGASIGYLAASAGTMFTYTVGPAVMGGNSSAELIIIEI